MSSTSEKDNGPALHDSEYLGTTNFALDITNVYHLHGKSTQLSSATAEIIRSRLLQDGSFWVDQQGTYYPQWLAQQSYPPGSLILGEQPNVDTPQYDVIRAPSHITKFEALEATPEAPVHLAVEATAYLQVMIDEAPAHEPLLAALGGAPLALKYHIGEELDRWTANNMVPLFVFDGRSIVGQVDIELLKAQRALSKTAEAWNLYGANKPGDAVSSFGNAAAIRAKELYGILQEVLLERNLPFKVAPFSACAQIAKFDQLDEQYVDGIMGSHELLLYNIFDGMYFPPSASDWEKKSFRGISKSAEIARLRLTPDVYLDALLMVGTSFLPHFPLLDDSSVVAQPFELKNAVHLLNTAQRSILNTCKSWDDVLKTRDPNWLDKFEKARMWVTHPIVAELSGEIKVVKYDTLTQDNPDYLGLHLPDELHGYMTEGMIGSRVLNPFVSLECVVYPTLDGGSSDDYKRLVTKSLLPIKESAFALISSRLNRVFQHKKINMRIWFDETRRDLVYNKDDAQRIEQSFKTWAVKEAPSWATNSEILGNRFFTFAVTSLQSQQAAKDTIATKPRSKESSETSVLLNVTYRFLQLRNYIDSNHQLTNWGKALATTLQAISAITEKYGNEQHVEEAVLLAYELLQFDCLHSRNPQTKLIGGPLRGSDEQKASCLLISRTACLLKVRHEAIGYTGPLSQNFLSFYSIIKEVRETDRDLMEATVASMILSGEVNKTDKPVSFRNIGKRLPLNTDIDVGMGIAVKTYLDDFIRPELSKQERQDAKGEYGPKYLPKSQDIVADLDVAFDFFDALNKGVQTLGHTEVPDEDKSVWRAAKSYLDERR